MFNLLPPNEKQNIIKEYSSRKFILMGIFAAALGLIGFVSLIPAYLLSEARLREVTGDLARLEGKDSANVMTELTKSLSQVNLKLSILKTAPSEHAANDLLKMVIDERGGGIRVSGFLYKRNLDKDSVISVNGVARDRESLSQFVERLKKNPLFSKVDLPVSNFAKDKNTEFSLQITGKF